MKRLQKEYYFQIRTGTREGFHQGANDMRFRSAITIGLLFFFWLLPLTLSAQTKQEALLAFQTLQSRCEAGVNFEMYAAALEELQSEVRSFLASREAQKNPGFLEKIERALIAYESAFLIWKSKIDYKQDRVGSEHPTVRLLVKVYPEARHLFGVNGQANVSNLVSFFWDQGDARILEAKRLTGLKK